MSSQSPHSSSRRGRSPETDNRQSGASSHTAQTPVEQPSPSLGSLRMERPPGRRRTNQNRTRSTSPPTYRAASGTAFTWEAAARTSSMEIDTDMDPPHQPIPNVGGPAIRRTVSFSSLRQNLTDNPPSTPTHRDPPLRRQRSALRLQPSWGPAPVANMYPRADAAPMARMNSRADAAPVAYMYDPATGNPMPVPPPSQEAALTPEFIEYMDSLPESAFQVPPILQPPNERPPLLFNGHQEEPDLQARLYRVSPRSDIPPNSGPLVEGSRDPMLRRGWTEVERTEAEERMRAHMARLELNSKGEEPVWDGPRFEFEIETSGEEE